MTMNLAGKSLPANPLCDLLETKYSRMWDVRAKTPPPACPSRGQQHPRIFTSCCQDAKGGLISHQSQECRLHCLAPLPPHCPRGGSGWRRARGPAQQHLGPPTEGHWGNEWRCPLPSTTPLPACSRFTPGFTWTWTELRKADSVTFFTKPLPGPQGTRAHSPLQPPSPHRPGWPATSPKTSHSWAGLAQSGDEKR